MTEPYRSIFWIVFLILLTSLSSTWDLNPRYKELEYDIREIKLLFHAYKTQ